MIIWLIGLSGSGKSYLADLLYQRVKLYKKNTFLMDGDSFREAMDNDLGYTLEDRYKNGWQLVRFSQMLNDQSINVIAPVLSIFHEHQTYLQRTIMHYRQIYVKSELHTIETKDVKGIYKNMKNIAGKDIQFPEPINSDYVFNNEFSPEKASDFVEKIIEDTMSVLD